ncbi:MAG: Lrp/AsnC family transcriptional regulator [Thaumarchaeota archaeon]|nr:MAG: Lrp/AsnC family transcriptional regulator [Nitrososphaerota archaeon]
MMESALVLLNCQFGCEQIVMQAIRRMPEVVEANFVFGGYDIVAKVAAETMDRLKAKKARWCKDRPDLDKTRNACLMRNMKTIREVC